MVSGDKWQDKLSGPLPARLREQDGDLSRHLLERDDRHWQGHLRDTARRGWRNRDERRQPVEVYFRTGRLGRLISRALVKNTGSNLPLFPKIIFKNASKVPFKSLKLILSPTHKPSI